MEKRSEGKVMGRLRIKPKRAGPRQYGRHNQISGGNGKGDDPCT